MSRWADLFDGLSERGRPRTFEGVIATNAPDTETQVEVIVAAFDRHIHLPAAPWMPRVVLTGPTVEILLPVKGDRCVVTFAETEDPGEPEVWILGYWPT